ncbi:MAG: N-acetylmuramoyl-L-alanine amidase [Nanoarchaeota archaeon]
MFSNKKGGVLQDVILSILQILILVGSLSIVGYFVNKELSKITFEKNYLAKDIALLTDTVYAAPSNVLVHYSYDKYSLEPIFEKKISGVDEYFRVRIIKPDEDEKESESYPFAKNSLEAPLASLKLKTGMTISKINNRVAAINNADDNILRLKCPSVQTKDNLWQSKTIMITPGHDKGGGIESNGIKEGDVMGDISQQIEDTLSNAIIGAYGDGRLFVGDDKDRMINSADMIIGLHAGKYDSGINNIKAYYSIETSGEMKNKNIKLACLILNKITDTDYSNIEISGTSIIPIFEQDYENAILPRDRPAILLEIGNLESEEGRRIFTSGEWGKLGKAIIDGIEEYYKT